MSSRFRRSASQFHNTLPINIMPIEKSPPLVRAVFNNVTLSIAPPDAENFNLPEFVHDLGSGMPKDTQYTLLVPLHLDWKMDGTRVTLRDYPLPLLNIPRGEGAWSCETHLVVAEGVGQDESTAWVECMIQAPASHTSLENPLKILVPKTIMPVKSYADPQINISVDDVTDIGWGVSYTPAIQDVMRLLDTLSPPPRDKSPAVGFWDKLRLAMHWRLSTNIANRVHLHVKGKLRSLSLCYILY